MNILIIQKLIRDLITYHLLSCFVICLVVDVDGVFGRADLKTKLLLKNIRTHLAQKVDEIVQQKECESGLILCKPIVDKEIEVEEKSEEIPPPPKILRGHHKPIFKVNPKDVIQTMLPKVHKGFLRRHQKKEIEEKSFADEHDTESEDTDEESEEKLAEKVKQFDKLQKHDLKPKLNFPDIKEKVGKVVKEEMRKSEFHKKKEAVENETKKKLAQKDVRKEFKKSLQVDEKKVTKQEKLKKDVKKKESDGKPDDIFSAATFIFTADFENKEEDLCAKHSNIYLKQLKKFKIWALMMFDATAKFPSGVLLGNINQLGDFDECLSINAVFKKTKPKNDFPAIKGKYCLANVDVTTNLETSNIKQVLERVESFSFIRSTIDDPSHFIPRFSSINWGLCVPAICPTENVKQFIESKLERYNNSNGLIFNVKVEEDNCVVKKDLKFNIEISMILVLLFYLSTIMTAIYATYRDCNQTLKIRDESEEELKNLKENEDFMQTNETVSNLSKSKITRFIMAFSLKKNLKILFSENENKDSVECINGVKALFTMMLYFAHKTIPLAWTPFSNRIFLTKMSNESSTVILRVSQIYTDGFLLISGLLTSYSLSREITKKGKISWIQKILARYIRLTPALMAVLLFYAYIWNHLGSGPLWNLVVKKNSILCQNYLWRNLLYIQNFFAFEKMCAPQTHHLAIDMQLSILAPFFVILIYKYDKVGIGIIQALFLVSSIVRYIAASNNELSVVIYHGMSVSQLYKTANLLYVQTLCRASPYLMGIIVGYYLQTFKNRFEFPRSFAAIGWIIAFSFGFYSITFPSHMTSRDYQYNVDEAAQYAALSPVSWSLALGWLISACHLGSGGKLNEFLCHKSFLVFSRISYSLYLTQFLVFFYKIGVKRIPETFTFTGSFDVTEFFVVVIASVIVTLLFDIPMIEIKQIILDFFFADESNVINETEEKSLLVDDLPQENETNSEEYLKENEQDIDTLEEEEEEGEIQDDIVEEANDNFDNDFESRNEKGDEEEDSKEENDEEEEEEEIPMQPLRRSITINFDDQSDDKDWLKIDEEPKEEVSD